MKERIKWIDIAKFFGIFAIYLGHYGVAAARSYPFVFTHHVPLFFFISGCMEIFNKEENFVRYAWKKIKTIMVPFWVFACISALLAVIEMNYEWQYVKALVVEILRGVVRNTYVAGSLWFLTCLFVLQLIFFWIKKLRYKVLVLIGAIVCYLIANYCLNPHPLAQPSLYYNVDSAIYYLIYYAIGYLIFPYILRLFELDSIKKKVLFAITAIGALAYTMGVFFGVDLLSFIHFPAWSSVFTHVLATCIMIYAYFVVARFIEDAVFLADIGKNTLYLCGSEHIVKGLFANLVTMFGLNIQLNNPLTVYIITLVLLIVANKYLVPVEKYIINKIVR